MSPPRCSATESYQSPAMLPARGTKVQHGRTGAGQEIHAPRLACRPRRTCLHVACSQAGTPQSYSARPLQYEQPEPQPPSALARRPSTALQASQPMSPVLVDLSQVVGKQVITRTTGRNLGVVGGLWVDPVRLQVLSVDLDDKKGVGSKQIANFPLARLEQIGDVVLVHDDKVLYEPALDGRFGYYMLPGLEVRTRSGEYLGKVRDFSFSPDNGALARIIYDDFGLAFLPSAFFDTFSLTIGDVVNVGVGGLVVSDQARYNEQRESSGVFAAIPSLLRTLTTGSTRTVAALTDGYRGGEAGSSVAGYLPQGYSFEQWEADVRRWEQETGMSYEQYTRMQAGQGAVQQQQLGQGRQRAQAALPPGQDIGFQPGQGRGQQAQQAGARYAQPQYGYAGSPQQQQQPQLMAPQAQQRQPVTQPSFTQPSMPGAGMPGQRYSPGPQQLQQQPQQPYSQYGMPNQQWQQPPVPSTALQQQQQSPQSLAPQPPQQQAMQQVPYQQQQQPTQPYQQQPQAQGQPGVRGRQAPVDPRVRPGAMQSTLPVGPDPRAPPYQQQPGPSSQQQLQQRPPALQQQQPGATATGDMPAGQSQQQAGVALPAVGQAGPSRGAAGLSGVAPSYWPAQQTAQAQPLAPQPGQQPSAGIQGQSAPQQRQQQQQPSVYTQPLPGQQQQQRSAAEYGAGPSNVSGEQLPQPTGSQGRQAAANGNTAGPYPDQRAAAAGPQPGSEWRGAGAGAGGGNGGSLGQVSRSVEGVTAGVAGSGIAVAADSQSGPGWQYSGKSLGR
ncbi:hypothetical protein QJQ45_024611 [Haematococcus lacustris]|nr:hypothetical protein QJQ45_024611 [Haematococcus lacustris]